MKSDFYKYTKEFENKVTIHCKNPYPSKFDEGIIEAMAQKFATPGQHPLIKLDPSKETRRNGAESCTFIVMW